MVPYQAAILALALAAGVTRADTSSAPATLGVPTSHGAAALHVATPDAFESVATDAQEASFRLRARVIVHAPDRASVERALGTLNAKPPMVAAGEPDHAIPGFFLVDLPTVRQAASLARSLSSQPGILEAYLDSRTAAPRSLPTDPGFPNQWFLYNTVNPQASVDCAPAWMAGFTGAGVTVGVIDEGFNAQHPDLAANFNAGASQPDMGFSDHGTATAGLVAEVANNEIGGASVAYDAHVARLYYGFESDNAAAFAFHNELTSIKTNSWGPPDIGFIYPMSSIEMAALADAVTTGRNGLGEVFVWACGNGAQNNSDRVDYDGYGSNRYSISIGAIDNSDRAAVYSEPGSSLMLVTTSGYDFAGSNGSGIYTTAGSDTAPPGAYTASFGGTSAASPIAAGAIALVLQANPSLTWRDVEHVLVRSARRVNPADPGWTANGAGRVHHYQFGFGAVDAAAAATLAQTFATLGPERSFVSPTVSPNLSIPDSNGAGVTSTIVMPSNIQVEKVQVVLTTVHPRIGDLRITLTSPSGSTSLLADQRSDARQYNGFVFTSVRHWDERSHGVWTLRIADVVSGNTGTLGSWQLRVYGGTPTCPVDWNASGHLDVQDIFDFLNDWLTGVGDFNNDGVVQAQDIFDFINAWFAGC